jgi:hypothetical protein
MDIAVIGSRDHIRTRCLDWQQPLPNLEEFDSVILDLTSLTQEALDALVGSSAKPLQTIGTSLYTLASTSRQAYCILHPKISASPIVVSGKEYPRLENSWDMLPHELGALPKSGKRISKLTEKALEPYFQRAPNWEYELFLRMEKYTRWDLEGVAFNKSDNIVAGKLKVPGVFGGAVYLLQPPTSTSTHEAIDVLIEIIKGPSGEGKPGWWQNISIPRAEEIQREIAAKRAVIDAKINEIENLEVQKHDVESYRNLLSETDEPLVLAVQRTLQDLGIQTEETEEGFPADLISKGKVAVEVTGIVDKISLSTPKIGQMMYFTEHRSSGEKVVLMANTYRREDPNARANMMDFSPQVSAVFPSMEVSALTTLTLYKLWLDVKTGKKNSEDVRRLILETNGVLVYS